MKKELALFDFDGTITTTDTLSEFFKFIQPDRYRRFYLKYILTLPYLLAYKVGMITSDRLKRERIKVFFSGMDYLSLQQKGNLFFQEILPSLIKESAGREIEWHLERNNDVYIVSASLDIILKPWCISRNVQLITNTLDQHTKCYLGRDCNKAEKVRRIRQEIDIDKYGFIYAYGDTEGDLQMLELADKKFYRHFK